MADLISVIQDGITILAVDAIVNATHSSLLGGGVLTGLFIEMRDRNY